MRIFDQWIKANNKQFNVTKQKILTVSIVPLIIGGGTIAPAFTSTSHQSSTVSTKTIGSRSGSANTTTQNGSSSTVPAKPNITIQTEWGTNLVFNYQDGYYMGATSKSNANMVTSPGVLPVNCPLPQNVTYIYYYSHSRKLGWWFYYYDNHIPSGLTVGSPSLDFFPQNTILSAFAPYSQRGNIVITKRGNAGNNTPFVTPMAQEAGQFYDSAFQTMGLYSRLPSLWIYALQYAVPNVNHPTKGQIVTVNLEKIMPPLNRYFLVSYNEIPSWLRKYWANPNAKYEIMLKANPKTGVLTEIVYNNIETYAFAYQKLSPIPQK